MNERDAFFHLLRKWMEDHLNMIESAKEDRLILIEMLKELWRMRAIRVIDYRDAWNVLK